MVLKYPPTSTESLPILTLRSHLPVNAFQFILSSLLNTPYCHLCLESNLLSVLKSELELFIPFFALVETGRIFSERMLEQKQAIKHCDPHNAISVHTNSTEHSIV